MDSHHSSIRRLVAAAAAVAVSATLLFAVSTPAAEAAPVTTNAKGCGTNVHVGVADAALLVAAMEVPHVKYRIPGDTFNCILAARQGGSTSFPWPFGFLLAGGARNLNITLERVGGCFLILCNPLPGPNDVKVTVTGTAGGCLGFMFGVRSSVTPDRLDFGCLAIRLNINASFLTGLDAQGLLSSGGSCPKGKGGSGGFSFPDFEVQTWRAVEGSPGTVNGLEPLQLVSGGPISDLIGLFVNPLIESIISACAGTQGTDLLTGPVQVDVAS